MGFLLVFHIPTCSRTYLVEISVPNVSKLCKKVMHFFFSGGYGMVPYFHVKIDFAKNLLGYEALPKYRLINYDR